jgi:hypothetical protein
VALEGKRVSVFVVDELSGWPAGSPHARSRVMASDHNPFATGLRYILPVCPVQMLLTDRTDRYTRAAQSYRDMGRDDRARVKRARRRMAAAMVELREAQRWESVWTEAHRVGRRDVDRGQHPCNPGPGRWVVSERLVGMVMADMGIAPDMPAVEMKAALARIGRRQSNPLEWQLWRAEQKVDGCEMSLAQCPKGETLRRLRAEWMLRDARLHLDRLRSWEDRWTTDHDELSATLVADGMRPLDAIEATMMMMEGTA